MPTFRDLLNSARARVSEVAPDEAADMLKSDGAVALDVREADEFEQGALKGAVHIPRGFLEIQVAGRIPEPKTPVVVYCAGGTRSVLAADTLAQALIEVPLSGPDEAPAMPYFDLARLVRYEGVRTDFTGPQLAKANAILAASDAEVEKADFTLNDMKGKKYTFSALRGKVVLVNFWATWCPPCPKELSDLDAVYVRLQSQGLIVLAITPDAPSDLNRFFSGGGVHLPVLLDTDGKVLEEFHVDGLPMTFVFNRKGRLAAKSINVRNQHQFLLMLAKAGLHP